MRYRVRLSPEAQADLVDIHDYVEEKAGSAITADRYVDRINDFLASFDIFPERGTVRDEFGAGVRIVGFERSASVVFLVYDDDVVVLRILGRGRELQLDDK